MQKFKTMKTFLGIAAYETYLEL